jgi:predicted DsbA family dithiol-disulfide isomerase
VKGLGMSLVKVFYFSDILCVWAYAAQARLDQIGEDFGDQVEIEAPFCSVFADAHGKISKGWQDRGGFEGFNAHLRDVGARFEHIKLHDRLWVDVRPRSSDSAHLFLKAVNLIEADDEDGDTSSRKFQNSLFNKATWRLRQAFFEEGRDISDWQVHRDICAEMNIDYARVEATIRSSEAFAHLAADYQLSDSFGALGSPTFVMNEGRQKLFGNVGYRLIEANIHELLRAPNGDEASWC